MNKTGSSMAEVPKRVFFVAVLLLLNFFVRWDKISLGKSPSSSSSSSASTTSEDSAIPSESEGSSAAGNSLASSSGLGDRIPDPPRRSLDEDSGTAVDDDTILPPAGDATSSLSSSGPTQREQAESTDAQVQSWLFPSKKGQPQCNCRFQLNETVVSTIDASVSPSVEAMDELMKKFVSMQSYKSSGVETSRGKRILFLGDSLGRHLFASLASASVGLQVLPPLVEKLLVQASRKAAASSPRITQQRSRTVRHKGEDDQFGGGDGAKKVECRPAHPLFVDPKLGKQDSLQWPPPHLREGAGFDTIHDQAADFPLLLRNEYDNYFSADSRDAAHWARSLNWHPTHVIVSRGTWDAIFRHPHNPRRYHVDLTEGLLALRRELPPGVPIIVYGLHRFFKNNMDMSSCFALREQDIFRDAQFCAVERANALAASEFPATTRFAGGKAFHYLDTMSVTSKLRLKHTTNNDGRHFAKLPMQHIAMATLRKLIDVSSIDHAKSAPSEKDACELPFAVVEDMSTTPLPCDDSKSAVDSVGTAVEKATMVLRYAARLWRLRGGGKPAATLFPPKMLTIKEGTEGITETFEDRAKDADANSLARTARDKKGGSKKKTVMPKSAAVQRNINKRAMGDAISLCSPLLIHLSNSMAGRLSLKRRLHHFMWHGLKLPRQTLARFTESLNPGKAHSPVHRRQWNITDVADGCVQLMDEQVTNTFVHSYLWPMTVNQLLYTCYDFTHLPYLQTTQALDPIVLDGHKVKLGCDAVDGDMFQLYKLRKGIGHLLEAKRQSRSSAAAAVAKSRWGKTTIDQDSHLCMSILVMTTRMQDAVLHLPYSILEKQFGTLRDYHDECAAHVNALKPQRLSRLAESSSDDVKCRRIFALFKVLEKPDSSITRKKTQCVALGGGSGAAWIPEKKAVPSPSGSPQEGQKLLKRKEQSPNKLGQVAYPKTAAPRKRQERVSQRKWHEQNKRYN